MTPARRPTGSRTTHPLPDGLEREVTPIHGVPILDASMVQRSAMDAAALVDSAAPATGIPTWAKALGIPAMVLLMVGLLVQEQRSSAVREAVLHAELKYARDAQTDDRKEFVKALGENTAAIKELDRRIDRLDTRGIGGERHARKER